MTNSNVSFLDLYALHKPLEAEFIQTFKNIIESNAFVGGESVHNFEKEFADYLGVKHVIGLNSGTDALIIALKSLGIGQGDEVITSACSFYATLEAILHVGATPIFVDVEQETGLIDTQLIEEKITANTKAIIPVHFHGQPASMQPILELAASKKIAVVEDACQSIGALYQGKQSGTLSTAGCFSFYPGKNLGALGDAGALVTNNDDVALLARKYGNHGGVEKFKHEVLGFNSRLDGLQAAFLSIKLKHIDRWNQARLQVAQYYNEALEGQETFVPNKFYSDRTSNHHIYAVSVRGKTREDVQSH